MQRLRFQDLFLRLILYQLPQEFEQSSNNAFGYQTTLKFGRSEPTAATQYKCAIMCEAPLHLGANSRRHSGGRKCEEFNCNASECGLRESSRLRC